MRKIEINVYPFNELSEKPKIKAISLLRPELSKDNPDITDEQIVEIIEEFQMEFFESGEPFEACDLRIINDRYLTLLHIASYGLYFPLLMIEDKGLAECERQYNIKFTDELIADAQELLDKESSMSTWLFMKEAFELQKKIGLVGEGDDVYITKNLKVKLIDGDDIDATINHIHHDVHISIPGCTMTPYGFRATVNDVTD